jgi:hypothetical protein
MIIIIMRGKNFMAHRLRITVLTNQEVIIMLPFFWQDPLAPFMYPHRGLSIVIGLYIQDTAWQTDTF